MDVPHAGSIHAAVHQSGDALCAVNVPDCSALAGGLLAGLGDFDHQSGEGVVSHLVFRQQLLAVDEELDSVLVRGVVAGGEHCSSQTAVLQLMKRHDGCGNHSQIVDSSSAGGECIVHRVGEGVVQCAVAAVGTRDEHGGGIASDHAHEGPDRQVYQSGSDDCFVEKQLQR